MKQVLLFIMFSFLLSSSCSKNKAEVKSLPSATKEGKNTIGFLLEGEVWVPHYKCRSFSNPCGEISARYDASGGAAPDGIDFSFTRVRENKSSSLVISSAGLGTITSTGDKIDSVGINYTGENSIGNTGTYSGIQPGSRFVITRFDKLAQIISGEFTFILSEDNWSGKTITLKDGRFDFRFNACKCSN